MSKLFNGWLGEVICLLAGAALTLSFAPFGIYPFAILCPAILIAAWLNVSVERAFWRGLLFGLGLFGTGISWVFISIHDFGNTSSWLAGLVTLLFVLVLALFPAINGYVLNRFFPKPNSIKIACTFPALWVMLEWFRSWVFSGFPWLFLGYSQIDTPLKGYAPLLSVYAVSLAVLLSSGLLVNGIIALIQHQTKKTYFYFLGIAFIWTLGSALSFITWTLPEGKPIQVSLIQGNVPQELKWNPDHVQPTLDLYRKLTEQHWDSQLIIWPEAAIPLPLQNAEDFLILMSDEASKHHAALITGIPIKTPTNQSYYNAVITLGTGSGIYVKQRLVPFGEFIPLKKYVGRLFAFLDIPMSDMVPSKGNPNPLIINRIKISPFICYEIAFPEQVLAQDGNVGLLLTVTDDAWFGDSIAQAQHLEMARMRSVETGRPGLFASNNGITAFITPTGKIQSAAPPYVQFVLTDTIQPVWGETPWQRIGMDPILLILIIALVLGWGLHQRN